MADEQQETTGDAPEGAVDPSVLEADPGPPERDGDNMAGPRATSDERAKHATESAEAVAAEDAQRSGG